MFMKACLRKTRLNRMPFRFSRLFCTTPRNPQEGRKMTEGYHKTYKHDPRVSMILKSSSSNLNMIEKHRYNTLIKF